MRISVDEELADLAEWADDPVFVRGACWALSRMSGVPADVLERRIVPKPENRPVTVTAPAVATDTAVVVEPVDDLGTYPGIGPITKLAEPPRTVSEDSDPTPPTPGSMAERFEQAVASGSPAIEPVDPETLARVEAELAAIRRTRAT